MAFTATAQSKEHLEEVKKLFQLVNQLQVEVQEAQNQKALAIEDLKQAREMHEMDIQHVKDVCNSKLRAKDYELDEMKMLLKDKEAIAADKV